MKKFFMKNALLFLLCGVIFCGCKNEKENAKIDGVFNPEKKISKISCYIDDHLMSWTTYHWEGDLLKSFDVYHERGVGYSDVYTYNTDNQVVRIENDQYIAEFEYDQEKRLVKIVQKDVEGNPIYSETVTERDAAGNIAVLQCDYINGEMIDRTETRFTWENGNYTTESQEYNDRVDKISYTYDDKINPMYGMYSISNSIFYQTKNNRIAAASVSSDGTAAAISTKFTYDADGYPVETVQENPVYDTKYYERYEYLR